MKIETANIRAMEERKRKEQAERPSNLVGDVDFLKSLKGFASQRPDIFVDATAAPKDRTSVKQPAVWDGHTSSIPKVTHAAMQNKSDMQGVAQIEPKPSGDAIGPKPAGPSTSQQFVQQLPNYAIPSPQNPYASTAQPKPPGPFYPPMPGMPPGAPPQFGGMSAQQVMPPHMRPPPMDEPASKRARTDDGGSAGEAALPGMVSEREWIASRPGAITVAVKVPTLSDTQFPLNGQTLRIQITVAESVKALKDKIAEQMGGMAVNKQKLQLAPFGLLNDSKTLAFYNLQTGVEVDLGLKERGGRKK
jgi:splicing factor 3A subunit 1